ncbi:hypothetical protein Tco_1236425 [Tanacetum coccineum]
MADGPLICQSYVRRKVNDHPLTLTPKFGPGVTPGARLTRVVSLCVGSYLSVAGKQDAVLAEDTMVNANELLATWCKEIRHRNQEDKAATMCDLNESILLCSLHEHDSSDCFQSICWRLQLLPTTLLPPFETRASRSGRVIMAMAVRVINEGFGSFGSGKWEWCMGDWDNGDEMDDERR